MRVLNVEPQDIHVILDLSLTEVKKILDALEHSEIKFDGSENPEIAEAADFLRNIFFKNLDALVVEVGGKQ